jgi:polyisoprenoid-binding protein YceI
MRFHSSRSFLPAFLEWRTHPVSARLLSLLILTLICLLLAACGGSSENDTSVNEAVAEAVSEAPTNTPAPPEPTVAPTESAPEATATEASAESSEAAPTEAASTEATTDPLLFVIDPEQSEARFIVDEVLFGNPNTVTGRTNGVSGEIEINLDDPAQTTVGEIQVDARSLATDNRFRNRSINRLILQSNRDEYQFITFTPTSIEGLPDSAGAGDTFSFQITGDLKIRDIVQPVSFDITVTADSATQISGLAQAVVQRADFELEIPNVEGVADVTEDVRLELQFVAKANE